MAQVKGLEKGAASCVIDEGSQINLQRLRFLVWDLYLRLSSALTVPVTTQIYWIHCLFLNAIYQSRSMTTDPR